MQESCIYIISCLSKQSPIKQSVASISSDIRATETHCLSAPDISACLALAYSSCKIFQHAKFQKLAWLTPTATPNTYNLTLFKLWLYQQQCQPCCSTLCLCWLERRDTRRFHNPVEPGLDEVGQEGNCEIRGLDTSQLWLTTVKEYHIFKHVTTSIIISHNLSYLRQELL